MITTSITVFIFSLWKIILHWVKSKNPLKQKINETKVSENTSENTIEKENTKNNEVESDGLPFEIEPIKPVTFPEDKVKQVELPKVQKDVEIIKDVIKPKIINKFLSKDQYNVKRNYQINQIILHFTQGGSFQGAFDTWLNNKEKIGTNYIIDKDGTIYCVIPEESWAYQLGMRFKSNKIDDKYKTKKHSDKIEESSIGIEIVNEGNLVKNSIGYYFEDGDRYISVDKTVRLSSPHRGYFDYVDFTKEQYESLEQLLQYLCAKYKITKEYKNPFNINIEALEGRSGIFSHVCYRSSDKTDCAPLPKLVNLLKNLKNK